jgi:hypothetical protein
MRALVTSGSQAAASGRSTESGFYASPLRFARRDLTCTSLVGLAGLEPATFGPQFCAAAAGACSPVRINPLSSTYAKCWRTQWHARGTAARAPVSNPLARSPTNRVLKMGDGGRLLLWVGGRAGCRRRLLTVLAADRRCRLAAGGCGSGGLRVEGGDAEEVVDGGGDLDPGSVAFSASVAELSSAGVGLDPSEGFLVRLRIDESRQRESSQLTGSPGSPRAHETRQRRTP